MTVIIKKKLTYFVFFLFVAVISLPIQSFAQSDNKTQNRLKQLEKQMQTMSRAVYRGEIPEVLPNNDIAIETNNNAANIELRISEIEKQLRQITGQLERNDHESRLLKKRLERLEMMPTKKTVSETRDPVPTLYATPKTKHQLGVLKIPSNTTATEPYMPVTRPTTIIASETPEKLYEQAYTNIRDGKYKIAAEKFESFLKKYPNNKLSANSQYWLAETYYVRGKYVMAAKLFAQGYETYPKSVKTADNLLKLGLSLSKTGKTQEACLTFAQLEKQFSGKSGVLMQRSRQEQKRIGCE